MSIQILPPEQPSPLAQLLTGASQGLGEGLQQFFQKKREREGSKKLAEILGLEGERAEAFQSLNPEQQKLAVSSLGQQQKTQQQAQKERAFAGALSKVLGLEPPSEITGGVQQGIEPTGTSGLGIQEISKLAELSQRERLAKGKIAAQRSSKVLERTDEIRESLPIKESSLSLMKDAIQTGDLSFFSRDNLAELTGIEGFRTAKGAQFITSGKEFFLGSIKRAGARPNIFVEQQIAKMMPKLGRSREANETVAASFQADLDVERERLRLTDEIEERFLKRNQSVPGNVGALISKELKPFAQERQDRLAEELKEIQSGQKGKGKVLTPEIAKKILRSVGGDKEKAREQARKSGFTF